MSLDIEFIRKAKNIPLFAAFCIEYKNCLSSSNPPEFMSAFPVIVDCTCNGVQHLAAMMADIPIAKSVNLVPQNTIQDIYSAVAEKVRAECKLPYNIDRSMVKKVVMTVPYNVSLYSANDYFISHFKYNPETKNYSPMSDPSIALTFKELQSIGSIIYKTFFRMHPALKIVVDYFKDMADILTAANCPIT
jgi:DNA-dependent RNA polymerase